MGWDVKIFPNIDNIANTKKPYLNIWTFLTISQYSPLLIISQFSQTNDNIHIMYIPVCALVWLDLQYVPFQFRGSTLFAGYTSSSQSQIRMKRTCLSFPDTHVEVKLYIWQEKKIYTWYGYDMGEIVLSTIHPHCLDMLEMCPSIPLCELIG